MGKLIRVAMLIQAYYPRLGGAERQLASLLPLLKKLGVESQIITRRYDSTLPSFEVIDDVPVYRVPVPGTKSLAALSYSVNTFPLLRKFQPDIIHAHELLSPATTAVIAKRIFNIPVVAKVLRGGQLGDIAKLKRRIFGSVRINSLKNGIDSFIVISNEIDKELAEVGVLPERKIFIPNGVDLNRFAPPSIYEKSILRQSLNLPNGLIAVFSGRLDKEKRVDQLVSIWGEVIKKYPDALLLILGSGTEEESIKKIAGTNVRFEGNIKNVAPYLYASDVFVLPSSSEGLSNSLLEAIASGLAPIATSVGGATDVIINGINGVLIPPNDPNALLSAMLTLFSNAPLRAEFGLKGRNFIEENYSLSSVAEKLNGLYRKHIYQQTRR